MPLQNRVTPDGQITASPWRGDLMGNRGGKIHDPRSKQLIKRRWASKRWINCVTKFKNRQRVVMGQGYTELFFLDEASALASGHRPCFECQRKKANAFAHAWQRAFGMEKAPRANTMDDILHTERRAPRMVVSTVEFKNYPTGTFFMVHEEIFVRYKDRFLLWSGIGYTNFTPTQSQAEVLTPGSIIKLLAVGYEADWHKSADRNETG